MHGTTVLLIWLLPVMLSITLHESAHALAAYLLGDNTAVKAGRLSINPLRHIDLVGTIIVPALILLLTHFQFVFGWAKPVPINNNKLRQPNRDAALVAAAGPGINLIMAILWTSLYLLVNTLALQNLSIVPYILLLAQAGVLINLLLAFINLIPIPPLDGSRIVASILPVRIAAQYMQLEPYGFLILLTLLFSGALKHLFDIIFELAAKLI